MNLFDSNTNEPYLLDGKYLIEPISKLPQRHGEWEEKETLLNEGDCEITEWQSARCSKCGKYHTTPYMYSFDNFNFCPNCGAEMKGREE